MGTFALTMSLSYCTVLINFISIISVTYPSPWGSNVCDQSLVLIAQLRNSYEENYGVTKKQD